MINDFAAKGYRTLGVARADDDGSWQFLGILPLYDPPREDSAETIAQAQAHGIQVKMVTGDNLAIAREIAGQLGLGKNIYAAEQAAENRRRKRTKWPPIRRNRSKRPTASPRSSPSTSIGIVKALQARGHIVGMTGDGVNDAPALKQADMGIAVSGATDAARAAADLVLTAPGLSVIINAVEEARRIFERMNSYAIYRITETIRIMIFVVLAMIVFNFYPITAIMIILLAFLNDVPIMTIAYDNTWLDPEPVRWNMHRVIAVSTVMGLTGVAGSFLMLYLAVDWLHLSIPPGPDLHLSENGRCRSPDAVCRPQQGVFPKKTLSCPDDDLVGHRHQAAGDHSGSLWFWPDHADPLGGNRLGLGLFNHLVLSHGLGQGTGLSSFWFADTAASDVSQDRPAAAVDTAA